MRAGQGSLTTKKFSFCRAESGERVRVIFRKHSVSSVITPNAPRDVSDICAISYTQYGLRLPPLMKRIFLSFGLIRDVRYFKTDVSGLRTGPIFKGQAVHKKAEDLGSVVLGKGAG